MTSKLRSEELGIQAFLAREDDIMALVESWARGLEVKGALEEKLSEWHRAEMEVELDMDVEHHEDIGEEHA